MDQRRKLHNKLEELLGNKNVYYQPPESFKLEYPCIKYSKNRIDFKKANDSNYIKNDQYEVIVIDRKPDNPVINKILKLPYCSFDRNYKSDNLNHDVLTLYF